MSLSSLATLAVHLAATLVDGDFERKSVHVKLLLLGTLRELTIPTNTAYGGYRSRVKAQTGKVVLYQYDRMG